jgi:pimeloyl-ACP methyl ester carboxylesterase
MEKRILSLGLGQSVQIWYQKQGAKLAVFHHGVPKPRELSPDELAAFAAHGYSVAAIVRPGYLESTAASAPPSMAEIAPITETVARQLGFDQYISVGFSGGGPRALSDATLNSSCIGAIIVGSVAAPDQDFDYLGSFPAEERESMLSLRSAGRAMLPQFEKWATRVPEFDNGATGWLDDELSMINSWGFDLSSVAKPVVNVASRSDQNVPFSHAEWLQSKLPQAALLEVQGEDHDHLMNRQNLEMALSRMAQQVAS